MNLKEFKYRMVRKASLVGMWIRMWLGYGLPFKETILADNYGFCNSKQPCLPSLPWSYPDFDISKLSAADNESLEGVITTIAGPQDNWHKEPDTGLYWPVQFFPRIGFPSWQSRWRHSAGLGAIPITKPGYPWSDLSCDAACEYATLIGPNARKKIIVMD